MAQYNIEKMKQAIITAITSKRSYVEVDGITFDRLPAPPFLLSDKKKELFAEKYADEQIKALLRD